MERTYHQMMRVNREVLLGEIQKEGAGQLEEKN